jgi:hypothetical protein|tara:strand:- start:10595 stop:12403 length:1809 start_codon:yes stop_codon:yes gene_type:complete
MPYTQVANLDFAQIKTSLIDYLRANSEFTDYDFSGSAISNLLDVLAYNTYYTAFNTNMVVNEMFLDSATVRDNVVALAKQIGYRPRSAASPKATVNLAVTYGGGSGTTPDTLVLKKGTGFVTNFDDTLYQYVVVDDTETPLVNGVATWANLDIYEGTLLTQSYTINTALKNQKFIIPNVGLDVSSIRVRVYEAEGNTAYQTYTAADNILELTNSSEAFFVEETTDENYEIFFGDGVFGKKLSNGNFVEISYLTTSTVNTNGAKLFSFSGIIFDKASSGNFPYTTSITTVSASEGGATIESLSSIKKSAPKAFASQDRAVTSADYASVVRKIYPGISDIITFGGEEDNPPEYGKVKVAVKPQNAISLSTYTKQQIVKELKDYTIASVTPVIVDPSILYIELDSTISYKTSKTTLSKAEIQNKATTAVEDYIASSETEKFNGKFRHSKFASVIDGSDTAITSNITNVTLRKDFYPTLNSTYYYELCFVNQFKDSCDESIMRSTGFIVSEYPSFTVYLEDDKAGKIDLYRLNSLTGEKVYLVKGVGDIDYKHGEIKLYNLTIIKGSFSDNKIEVRVEPASRDINAVRELYLDVDIAKSKFSAVPE